MSVIIRDLDLPPKCQYCPCCYIENETAVPPNKPSKPICSVWGDSIQDMYNSRNDDCPLIPLPQKHGRLIDADVVYANIDNLLSGDGAKWLAESAVHDAPTVIEAEDEE